MSPKVLFLKAAQIASAPFANRTKNLGTFWRYIRRFSSICDSELDELEVLGFCVGYVENALNHPRKSALNRLV